MNSARLLGRDKQLRLAKFILVTFGIMLWLFNDSRKSVNNALNEDTKSSSYIRNIVKHARRQAKCIQPPGAKHYIVCKRYPLTNILCGERPHRSEKLDDLEKGYRVPNIAHFVWFGEVLNISSFLHYLALRSVASIQRPHSIYLHYNGKVVVKNPLYKRIRDEIPCLRLNKYKAPENINDDLFKSDVARIQILQKYGGIYLDLDVITLKPLESLRVHPVAVGRSRTDKVSNGIILSEPNSTFLDLWLHAYKSYDPNGRRSLAFWGLNVPYRLSRQQEKEGIVHMDEILMNRPNPYQDSLDATTIGHYDVSRNYFLHVHPRAVDNTEIDVNISHWTEDRLRTLDSTFGHAARVALFGSSELVYKRFEFFREPFPKQRASRLGVE